MQNWEANARPEFWSRRPALIEITRKPVAPVAPPPSSDNAAVPWIHRKRPAANPVIKFSKVFDMQPNTSPATGKVDASTQTEHRMQLLAPFRSLAAWLTGILPSWSKEA